MHISQNRLFAEWELSQHRTRLIYCKWNGGSEAICK
jgi:hypothetical protein